MCAKTSSQFRSPAYVLCHSVLWIRRLQLVLPSAKFSLSLKPDERDNLNYATQSIQAQLLGPRRSYPIQRLSPWTSRGHSLQYIPRLLFPPKLGCLDNSLPASAVLRQLQQWCRQLVRKVQLSQRTTAELTTLLCNTGEMSYGWGAP